MPRASELMGKKPWEKFEVLIDRPGLYTQKLVQAGSLGKKGNDELPLSRGRERQY